MRLELLILLGTAFFVINIYHDGKYIRLIKSWKKYYQMTFYGFLGLSLYLFVKKYPQHTKGLMSHANTFVKYIPMDKDSGDILTPLLSMSSKFRNPNDTDQNGAQYSRMMDSGQGSFSGGKTKTNMKRSVSETKKKFVAANQNWKCANCSCQLPAWFEVDHKIRLDRGGDNHINNLEALCRDCHGKKTSMESMI